MNVAFSAFISVHWKWMFCSLHSRSLGSFLFCKKNISFILVRLGQKWFKNGKKLVKECNKRTKCCYVFCKRTICSYVLLQKNDTFLCSFMFFAKECCVLYVLLRSLQKKVAFSKFFYVLCKRTFRSLRSFTFFAKECNVLCVFLRSLEKNVKELNVLLGFISRQKHEKRT